MKEKKEKQNLLNIDLSIINPEIKNQLVVTTIENFIKVVCCEDDAEPLKQVKPTQYNSSMFEGVLMSLFVVDKSGVNDFINKFIDALKIIKVLTTEEETMIFNTFKEFMKLIAKNLAKNDFIFAM